jgi:hypothetical protein
MKKLKSEQEYINALNRIDELLQLTGDDVPPDDPNMVELLEISDLVYYYESIHYPMGKEEHERLGLEYKP